MPKRRLCTAVSEGAAKLPNVGAARDQFYLRFDGGSRGNPGVAGSGAVIYNSAGKEVWHGYHYVGSTNTNNQAEYDGLIVGLEQARRMNIGKLHIEGDSLLVINQVKLLWKVKNEGLRPYHTKARALVLKMPAWSAGHIPREENARADKLSNDAMDTRGRDSTLVTELPAAAAVAATPVASLLDLMGGDDDVAAVPAAKAASAVAPSSTSSSSPSSSQQAPAVSTDAGSDALVSLVIQLVPPPPSGAVGWAAFTGVTNIMVVRSTGPGNLVRLELPCVAKTHATPAACVDYIVGDRDGVVPPAGSSSSASALSLPHVGSLTLISAANDADAAAADDHAAARFLPAELAVRQAITAAYVASYPGAAGSIELVAVPSHDLTCFIQDSIVSADGPCRVSVALQSFAAAAAMLRRT